MQSPLARVMRVLLQRDRHPEVLALKDCPQDRAWHPEGGAFEHTMYVVGAGAAIVAREALAGARAEILLLACLCHDLGKPGCTTHDADGRIRSRGHDVAGEAPTRSLLERLGYGPEIIEPVVRLVVTHMAHIGLTRTDNRGAAVRKLAERLGDTDPQLWAWVVEADHSGRPPLPQEAPGQEYVEELKAAQVRLGEARYRAAHPPIVSGRVLLDAGLMPEHGPARGRLLEALYRAQRHGLFVDVAGGLDEARALIAEGV
jgi:tRNA nucleotidyltransferase (CCA-adding enzyme)